MSVNDGKSHKDDVGQAAQIGDWWAMATAQSVVWPHFIFTDWYEGFSVLMQLALTAEAFAESSSLDYTPAGIKMTATTAAVLGLDIREGAKIELSAVNNRLETNAVWVNSLAKVELTDDVKVKTVVNEIMAVVTEVKASTTNVIVRELDATVTQQINA